jgi:hypothetical protein
VVKRECLLLGDARAESIQAPHVDVGTIKPNCSISAC